MYVVIVCAHCGGSSQVDEAELGKPVECPLCGKPTVARTKEAILPVARPVAAPEAPLSLDDAPQLPALRPPAAKPPAPKRSPLRKGIYAAASLLATLVLMGGIYGAFRYGTPDIPDSAWKRFLPPDGRCSIELPGEAESQDIAAEGFAVVGGKRFTVKRWFERVELSFGWIDLEADRALEKHFDSLVFDLLRREMKRLNGQMSGEQTVNFNVKGRKWEARRYQGDAEKGKAIVQIYFDANEDRLNFQDVIQKEPRQVRVFVPSWLALGGTWVTIDTTMEVKKRVFAPGQRLRLYFATAVGKKLKPDTSWVGKFFNSFSPD
jgi:hypothetical protein